MNTHTATNARSARAFERTSAARPSGPSQTTVRFLDGEQGCSVLEIETTERSGFMRGLSQALLQHSVQILRAEVRRVGAGAIDRFIIADHDGSPLSLAKKLALQVAVLSAVDLAAF